MAGYALSRLRWRGRDLVLTIIIATLIVPFETVAIPLLLVVSKLPWIGVHDGAAGVEQGWLNTYQVQILPFAANAFSIFLFAQFFKSLPIDLDEAARVDGAGGFQIYRQDHHAAVRARPSPRSPSSHSCPSGTPTSGR